MYDDFFRCNLTIRVTAIEAAVICEAVRISSDLTDAGPNDDVFVPDIGSPFRAHYPGTPDDPLADFFALFSDREWPIFGASVTALPLPGERLVDLRIQGEDVEIDSFAQLLFHSARSALPIDLRYYVYAFDDDPLPYRSGFVIIAEQGTIYGSCIDNRYGVTGTGYLIAADTHDDDEPLIFWNAEHGFGDASSGTVFTLEEVQLHCLPLGSTRWVSLPTNDVNIPPAAATPLLELQTI